MATIKDKFELAVYSLKINQLAETLGSGGFSLGKAIKRRYTTRKVEITSTNRWEFGKTCALSEPEKKMKMSVRGLFTMILINSQLAGMMSALDLGKNKDEKGSSECRTLLAG
ncbi:hypothetical protein LXL04_015736 [Taraxacum kok-saghyz]